MAAVDIAQLLAFAVKNNASDLHLSSGVPPPMDSSSNQTQPRVPNNERTFMTSTP